MGKDILDIYRDPDAWDVVGHDVVDARMMIDRGGPQAAWGACVSLAARKRRGGNEGTG